jgi:hypothetical protein
MEFFFLASRRDAIKKKDLRQCCIAVRRHPNLVTPCVMNARFFFVLAFRPRVDKMACV